MRIFITLILLFLLNSCTKVNLLEPEYSDGSSNFGTQIALKWHKEILVAYGSKLGSYFLLSGGAKDSSFFFEGTWRHMQNLETGLLRLEIGVDDGALNLWNNSVSPESVKLAGSFASGNNPNTELLKLTYLCPLSNSEISKNFLIVSHRGGVRNADYIGI